MRSSKMLRGTGDPAFCKAIVYFFPFPGNKFFIKVIPPKYWGYFKIFLRNGVTLLALYEATFTVSFSRNYKNNILFLSKS